jgi:hypothetical protein
VNKARRVAGQMSLVVEFSLSLLISKNRACVKVQHLQIISAMFAAASRIQPPGKKLKN